MIILQHINLIIILITSKCLPLPLAATNPTPLTLHTSDLHSTTPHLLVPPPSYGHMSTSFTPTDIYSHNPSYKVSLFYLQESTTLGPRPTYSTAYRLLERPSKRTPNTYNMLKLESIFFPFFSNPFFSSTKYSTTISTHPKNLN